MVDNLVHRPVAEVMTPYLITCAPWTTLAEAREQMAKNHIRRLPVVDEGKLVGIITREDILQSESAGPGRHATPEEVRERLAAVTVQVVMTRKPLTVYQSDTIGHVAEILLDNKIGSVPVLDEQGALAGIVTESDLFRTIVRRWRDDNLLLSGAH